MERGRGIVNQQMNMREGKKIRTSWESQAYIDDVKVGTGFLRLRFGPVLGPSEPSVRNCKVWEFLD
jgi:hypothetical protein